MIKQFGNQNLNVINDITYFNADDIVSEYFSNNRVRHKDLDIDIISCWFCLEDNEFKQCAINNILHILKTNNHQFYNEIEYGLFGRLLSLFYHNCNEKHGLV